MENFLLATYFKAKWLYSLAELWIQSDKTSPAVVILIPISVGFV
jgi:hypothetical protein